MAKAVLANRIFIELQDTKKLKDTLTYRIPPANENYGVPLVLRSYKQYKPGIISIPIGRTDLIPEGHEVEDLRVAPEVAFPEFNGLLRPSQQEIYDQIEGNALINAKVSFGKAQPLYSKIKTPNGWTTMKDIAIGDTVTTPDGGEATVINKFFHYDKPIFRVTTLDGRIVDACEDHLWSIYIKDSKKQKLKTTKELIELLNQGKVISLPLTSEIRPRKAKQNFIIHPYVLGILLGDGSISTNGIGISSADDFIIKKVNSLLPENHTLKYVSKYDYRLISEYEKGKARKNLVLNELRRLNLLGTRSHTKFIPNEYKNLDLKNTLYLIQGLMDSDGWVDKIGTSCEFCSSSKQLMDDFCELIYSMGGCAAIQSKTPTYIYKGEKKDGKITYRARPNKLPFHIKKELFSLPRKKDKILPGKLDNSNKVKISKIEYLNNQDCCCIEIDSEASLYITDNYLVTHNTFTALAIAKKFGYKTLIITHTLALRNQWEAEIKKVFGITPGIIGSGKWNINSPIVVSNVQTLSKKAGLLKKEFGTIVVDETHHLPAKSFMETLDIFWAKVKIGLSGTLVRKDGKHVLLKDYFGGQLFTPPAENALEPEVHIHNPAFVLPSSNNWADRVTLLETNEAYQHYIAKLAAAYAAVGHHVLVVGGRVEFLEQVANLLGKTAVCITGNVKDRDELLKKVGDTHNVLCGTLSIFSEGISHNILSCVILATPINNDPLLEQLTGRIVRICEGKRSPVVVDIQLKDNTSKNQATARNKFYFSKDWKIKMIQ